MEKEIYKTLAYADIFNYPLTGNQIFHTVGIKVRRKKFLSNLQKIPHEIHSNLLYYFLPGREEIVRLRMEKEKYSQSKIKKAKKIISLLSWIPTIRFIGISGSVAMHNAEKKSDIDLFFITLPYSVWITRLLIYCVLELLGLRRRKGHSTRDSICANMFVDEDHLRFPIQKRNLYLAHEIVQLFPVVNKNNTYEKFVLANVWIQNYFPNYPIRNPFGRLRTRNKEFSFSLFLFPLEFFMRNMQLWYMEKSKTRETTTPSLIAFHPIDYESQILNAYTKKIKNI
ncbi:MAG TPA: hypothetical protein VEW42_06270 [Candidatus Eisenbacteria bacterium]|jgi:hypothetical protein|nr:hypothetical protein [Candidatus Eisenbacteria bacterium]